MAPRGPLGYPPALHAVLLFCTSTRVSTGSQTAECFGGRDARDIGGFETRQPRGPRFLGPSGILSVREPASSLMRVRN